MDTAGPPPAADGVKGPVSHPTSVDSIPESTPGENLTQNPNPSHGCSTPQSSVGHDMISSSQNTNDNAPDDHLKNLLRPDGSLPADGNAQNLGFRQNTIQPRRYPKISSNFDMPPGSSRQQQQQDNTRLPMSNNSKLPETQNRHAPEKQPTLIGDGKGHALPRKSFAEAAARKVAKPPDVFTHSYNSIQPIKMSDGLTVIMPEALYEKHLRLYQYALIGRLILPQGAAPHTAEQLKGELISTFVTTGDWTLIPLGKGFFSMKFLLQEDQIKAARQSTWKLSVGFLQIRDWKPNFDPYKELSSTAQIWVRLFHLPTEYWGPEFLVGVFRAVGNVIKLDGNTAQGLVGYFARALVEVDLASLSLTRYVSVSLTIFSTSILATRMCPCCVLSAII